MQHLRRLFRLGRSRSLLKELKGHVGKVQEGGIGPQVGGEPWEGINKQSMTLGQAGRKGP